MNNFKKIVYALVGNKLDRIGIKDINLEEIYKVAQVLYTEECLFNI